MTDRHNGPARPVGLAVVMALVLITAATLLRPSTPAFAASATFASLSTTTSSVPTNPSSGCLQARPIRPGLGVQYLNVGGDVGAYYREVPPSYTGRSPMPVIVDLHGYGVSAAQMVALTQLGNNGKRDGYITVTPQVGRPTPYPYWQTGFQSKDVAFLKGVLTNIESTLCADQNRIFVTGYSNGAVMASVLACVDAAQVAAIAPVSGIANPANCNPSRPVPVVAFHGTSDPLLSYTGGFGAEAYKLPLPAGTKGNISQLLGPNVPQGTKGPSIPTTTAAWAKRDGCTPTSTTRVVANNVALISYSCPKGGAVRLYRIRGGGHTWPGSVLDSKVKGVGSTTMAISADRIIWSFFSSHPLGA